MDKNRSISKAKSQKSKAKKLDFPQYVMFLKISISKK